MNLNPTMQRDFREFFNRRKGTYPLNKWNKGGFFGGQGWKMYLLTNYVAGSQFRTRDNMIVNLTEDELNEVWAAIVPSLR